MEQDKIARIIEQLESMKSRPAMFLGKAADVDATIHFFHGYYAAIFIIEGNCFPNLNIYQSVREQRGWEWTATSVARQMKEKFIFDEEIVQELINIEIEAWKMLSELETNN